MAHITGTLSIVPDGASWIVWLEWGDSQKVEFYVEGATEEEAFDNAEKVISEGVLKVNPSSKISFSATSER